MKPNEDERASGPFGAKTWNEREAVACSADGALLVASGNLADEPRQNRPCGRYFEDEPELARVAEGEAEHV